MHIYIHRLLLNVLEDARLRFIRVLYVSPVINTYTSLLEILYSRLALVEHAGEILCVARNLRIALLHRVVEPRSNTVLVNVLERAH